jgi:hypothetical protein
MVKLGGHWPFVGTVVWLTPEQGGRSIGPPPVSDAYDYAHTAFVPPSNVDNGLASFALRGFTAGAWTSPAEARWCVVDNEGPQEAVPGSVIAVTEGRRIVAYFTVERVEEPS